MSQQGRERRRLAERVDRELDADRAFFERFPHRRYYVRPIFHNEHIQIERVEGRSLRPPPGFDVFVAVEETFYGARLRIPFGAPISIDTGELTEEDCRQIFFACLTDRRAEVRERLLRERLRCD